MTAVDIDRVLGFEATTISDWSIIQSGPGTLSVSTTASQGSRALAVASHGYVPVQSVALSSLGSRVGSVIHCDIMSPSQLKQVSPSYYGATQLYLNSPSLGLNSTYLGQVELTPLPVGQWNTVTFTPTSSVLTKLRGTYTDLRVTIVVNAPYNVTQPYLVDNLRFSDKTLALANVVDGSGQPISGLTVVAYNGSTPTSNTGVTDSTGLAKVWVPPGSYRFGVTDAGVTTHSSATNQCEVPGICVAVTITDKCHNVVCTAKDTCHNAGTCNPGTGACSNPAKPAGTVCRAEAGPCDLAELCDGTDAGCPTDSFVQTSLVCRPAAGPCDAVEVCSGTSAACPADVFLPASTVCRPAAGICDVTENCSGANAACPVDQKLADDTSCDDGNACTMADKCQSGVCQGGSTVTCPTPDQCHLVGTCQPATGTCPNVAKPDGTDCHYATGCPGGDPCQTGSCMGGICAPCKGINLVASKSYDPAASTDGEQSFSPAALFAVPTVLRVMDGLAGNGTASLSIQAAGACPTCFARCNYKGASTQEHPATPQERTLALFYVIDSCDSGLAAGQKLLVTDLRLHVEKGDSQAGTTTVQHLVSCQEDQTAVVQAFPPDSGQILPNGSPEEIATPESPVPSPPGPPGGPDPNQPPSNPEVNGVYVPVANPELQLIDLSL